MEKIKNTLENGGLSREIQRMYDAAQSWDSTTVLNDKIVIFCNKLTREFGKETLAVSPVYRELLRLEEVAPSEILETDREDEISTEVASFVAEMITLINNDFKEF